MFTGKEKKGQIIDVDYFQRLQDNLSKAVDMAILTVDFKGVPITKHSRCTDFCNILRQNVKTRDLCQKCDSRGGIEAARLHEPYIYLCHQGLVDLAVPIMVKGQYYGAIMAGQVQLLNKEEAHFLETISSRAPLEAIDFYEQSAVHLKEKLPKMSLEKIQAIGDMLFDFSKIIANQIRLENDAIFGEVKADERASENPYKDSSFDNILNPSKPLLGTYAFLNPALAQLSSDPCNRYSVEEMAKMCNISEGYFSKSFQKATGLKFSAYQNQLKIQYSENLLKHTDMSITEISYRLGYDSSSYYIRIFKALLGVTPNYYRESYVEKSKIQYRY